MALLPRTDVDLALVLHNPCHDTQRNSLCSISRLPAELLAIIFIHNARDSYVREKYDCSTPSWVNVSYVCCHWRYVALNCPPLWAYIPAASQRWTQELLARSQNAPLEICIIQSKQLSPIVEQMANHAEHIQTLCLNLDGVSRARDSQFLSKFLFSCVPCLKYLDISGLNIIQEPEASLLPFKGKTPALCTLRLVNCSIPWYSFTLSGLTVLDLFSIPPSLQQTIVELLIVLCRMPSLIHLSLNDVLLSAHDFLSNREFRPTPTTNLPCLSELSVTAPISTVVAFLTCVYIPLAARVRLECLPEELLDDFDSIYYPQLSSLLTQRVTAFNDSAITGPTIRSMVIRNSNPIELQVIFSVLEREYEIIPMYSTKWDHNTRLCVTFYPEKLFAVGDEVRMLDDFCGPVPLANIRSLHFLGPLCSLNLWKKMSKWLPNLRYMKLSNGYMPDITPLLHLSSQCDRGSDADRSRNEAFVPGLEELELYSIGLSGLRVQEYEANLPVLHLKSLCDAISTRKETRCGLTVNECYVYTNGGAFILEATGQWKNDRFRVTSRHTYKKRAVDNDDYSVLHHDMLTWADLNENQV